MEKFNVIMNGTPLKEYEMDEIFGGGNNGICPNGICPNIGNCECPTNQGNCECPTNTSCGVTNTRFGCTIPEIM